MFFSKDSFFSDIKHVYLKLITMEELVWISSILWISWFGDILFPRHEGVLINIFFLLLVLWTFYIYMTKTRQERRRSKKKWYKWKKSFMRIFNIPGSTLFLFLFLNYFLKISTPISQSFSEEMDFIEKTYGTALLAIFVLALLILGIFHLFYLLKRFLKREIERRLFGIEVVSIIFLVVIFLPLFYNKFCPSFYRTFIVFLLKWFFGISLLFLHFNYLIGEIKILFKIQNGFKIQQ
ncbi:hypothetical protein J7K24_00585 [bacterium]|nr:hypothetical protein [bacterium]